MLCVSLGFVWFTTLTNRVAFGSLSSLLLTPVFAVLTYIRSAFSLFSSGVFRNLHERLVLQLSRAKSHSNTVSTIIGVAITIPILIILVGFFASADPIYYSFVQKVFSEEFLRQLPSRFILTILICITTIPFVLPRINTVAYSPGSLLSRLRLSRELTIVMAGVAFVLASFIVVQWKYIFVSVASETSLSQYGVDTYAEYVTKGFIELLRVSAFIYALIWLGLSALRNTEFKSKWLFYLQMFVLGEFLVILASIYRRVYLYQLYHGLSLIRVYGTFFLVFLTGLTLTLAARHLFRKARMSYFEAAFIFVLFLVIGVFNAESFIAKNDPPTVNKRVDYVYLARMSPDGVEGWVDAFNHVDSTLQELDAKSDILTKDERRDVALSYSILQNILVHYEELVRKQGTDEEFSVYMHKLISFQKEQVSEYIEDLQKYQESNFGKTDISWVQDTIERQEHLLTLLNDLDKSIDTPEVVHKDQYTDVSSSYWSQDIPSFDSKPPNLNSFYNSSEYYFDSRNPRYSTETLVDRRKKFTQLDKVYLYNYSSRKALEKIQKEIPFEKFLKVQRLYFKIQERIQFQNERDYSVDISFDTPLL